MIATLNGVVAHINEQTLVVQMHGIGMLVHVSQVNQFQQGQNVSLVTHMHWNQEQGPSLYGFLTELERTIFTMVIDCSGIGPKIALAILADLGTDRFIAAVHANNEKELSSVSGIGPKKAEQMLVHLKHKVAKLIKSGIVLQGASASIAHWQEVTQVLESLNYSKPEINDTLKHLRETSRDVTLTFDQLVRSALSFLAKRA